MRHPLLTYGPLLLCALFLLAPAAGAQDYEERRRELLQKQENAREEIQRLNRQIASYQERISEASQQIDSLSARVENLNRLIALQDEKLNQMNAEQRSIREEISLTNQNLEEQRSELNRLMETYQSTLTYIYKHGRATELALLLTSGSFNEMLRRAYYLRRFDEYLEEQVSRIREVQARLERSRDNLLEAQQRNRDLLAEIQSEKQRLDNQLEQQEEAIAQYRQDREQARRDLQEAEKQRNDFDNLITEVNDQLASIPADGSPEERVDEATGERVSPSAGFMDEETLDRMETAFSGSKGSLRWPVESSTIAEPFGQRRHPAYGTVTNNLGIEIITDPAEPVRAVSNGYVIAIRPLPGYGDVVMVKHGRFITAYGNLSEVNVRQQALLQEGDLIGHAGESDSPRGESLYFVVRENNTNLNPEEWLSPK